MTFNPDQIAALVAPLDRAHVAQRKQGGASVSYIAGWHAIAEANRIFGFDSWNRETVELRLLGDPREVDGKVRVEYMARVRIRVGDIIRDGCGFGQGIDKDVGQAHESALKEAETDAMKRALMTFGNPFGLALYDKSQSNVQDAPAPALISDVQRDELVAMMEGYGVPVQNFCQVGNLQSLKELRADAFDKAKSWIQSQRKAA
ncbi:MAG: RAD52 family DNA repair protein [Pseudomonadota bacterium]